ncbi:MAG: hypothetical protein RLZZ04_386, partial [Cyanobacteriota bacterium]
MPPILSILRIDNKLQTHIPLVGEVARELKYSQTEARSQRGRYHFRNK